MRDGIVVSLNISPGGVPKLAVARAMLGNQGFVGDGHDDVKHHGGAERAVCIYAVEIINALREEGHPIRAGTAGENLTVSGLDWSLMLPGVKLAVGHAIVELVSYTSPCKTIRDSFINGRFQRISQITNPGWSRVYGRVLVEGLVRVGDSIAIIAG